MGKSRGLPATWQAERAEKALRKWEGLKSGLPLASPPPQSLKCEKASKTTWPMIKTSFGKASPPPLHNEWIVPKNIITGLLFVSKENPHQRQFLTRVIDLHWLIFACDRHCFKRERLNSVEVWVGPPHNFKPNRKKKLFCQASKIASCHVPITVVTHLSTIHLMFAHIFKHRFVFVCVCDCAKIA